jgi:hypothetical protein
LPSLGANPYAERSNAYATTKKIRAFFKVVVICGKTWRTIFLDLGMRILDFVFSNSSWKDGRLIPTYRKQFDLLAVTNAGIKKERAIPPKKHGPFENWLPKSYLSPS